jgi:hypothetical protein
MKASPKTAVGFDRANNFFIIDFFWEVCVKMYDMFFIVLSRNFLLSCLKTFSSFITLCRNKHESNPCCHPYFCWNGDGMSHVGKCMQNICILILLW